MTSLPTAVLWDLDGTLIDTEPYWIACEHELVAQHGGRWTDADAHSIVGFDLLDSARIIRDRGGVNLPPQEIVDRLCTGVIERIRRSMPWRPGARELLTSLNRAGVPCALVTMSWKSITDEVLRQIPPGTFRAVITGDMVMNGKPHPEPYRRAAEALGVDPLSCVAIEDSPTGVASAEAAGCVVVAVPHLVPIAPARHRVALTSLVGVTPEQLGDIVETTPPPVAPPDFRPSQPGRPHPPYDGDDDLPPARVRRQSGIDQRAWSRGGRLLGGRGRLVAAGAALVVLLAALGVWWFAIRDTQEPYEPGAFNVHTWAPYWSLDQSTSDLESQYNLFHQVSPFWYRTTGVADISVDDEADPDAVERFLDTARSRGVPIVASIFDRSSAGVMAGILADPVQRAAHIEAIATFAEQNGFAGIDLDYEQFAFRASERASWSTTRPNFTTFVQELSARLAADGRYLVVTVPPIYNTGQDDDSGFWVYDYGGIAPHVNAIRIMAYDKNTDDGPPGPIAPLDWTNSLLDAAVDAAGGPEKLVLGIPLYGYNWLTGVTGTCPDSAEDSISVTLDRVEELLATRDVTAPVFDPVAAESSFTYQLPVAGPDGTTACTQTREVHYLDDEAIRQRMQLSIDRGLLGVALYAFGYESDTVFTDIAAINATLATTATTTPT